ncbi:hypothetical protein DRN67_00870 [Candidatus Micrarchaeota archaeon]|nr:MAG: hypothetical protein DRN67_00870 [Candidatus Micrarchaeota archaeon]
MKIAFFTDSYLPQWDGVVSTIMGFRKELERQGHEVYIFAAGSRRDKAQNKDSHVYYHTSVPFKPYPAYRVALFPYISERRVRKLGIDIIHTHGMATLGLAALTISKITKIPMVGTFHTMVTDATHYISSSQTVKRIGKKLAWKYLKWYYDNCEAVLAPSEWTCKLLRRKGIRNVIAVHPGIDTKRFKPGIKGREFRKKYGLGNSPVVLHIGRIVLEKNIGLLIRAAPYVLKKIPNCKFVIAGKGPAEAKYKRMVERKGLEKSFVFAGFLPGKMLPRAYAGSDVLAFPSTFETLGIVALEAMACGLPVACADHGPLKSMVKNGRNGIRFNPKSPKGCAEAIVRVYKGRERLGSAAAKMAEKYDTGMCVKRLVEVYEKVLEKKG